MAKEGKKIKNTEESRPVVLVVGDGSLLVEAIRDKIEATLPEVEVVSTLIADEWGGPNLTEEQIQSIEAGNAPDPRKPYHEMRELLETRDVVAVVADCMFNWIEDDFLIYVVHGGVRLSAIIEYELQIDNKPHFIMYSGATDPALEGYELNENAVHSVITGLGDHGVVVDSKVEEVVEEVRQAMARRKSKKVAESRPLPHGGKYKDLTVLVMDDDEDKREANKILLEGKFGCKVELAHNFDDAIEKTKHADHPVDVLVTDLIFPIKKDEEQNLHAGVVLARAIRENPNVPNAEHMQIIILSAGAVTPESDLEVRTALEEKAVNAYIKTENTPGWKRFFESVKEALDRALALQRGETVEPPEQPSWDETWAAIEEERRRKEDGREDEGRGDVRGRRL